VRKLNLKYSVAWCALNKLTREPEYVNFFLMFVIPMCLSNIYDYKISIKTQPFIT